jgi:hypothetical protein
MMTDEELEVLESIAKSLWRIVNQLESLTVEISAIKRDTRNIGSV